MIALQHGGKLPLRSTVLAAARDWGVPPWEVMRGPAVWLVRWTEENNLRAELQAEA